MFLSLPLSSRVHITEATLNHLGKAYEVEDGNGHQRDLYLKAMNIKTFLVIDPRVRVLFLNSVHVDLKNQWLLGRHVHPIGLGVMISHSDCPGEEGERETASYRMSINRAASARKAEGKTVQL